MFSRAELLRALHTATLWLTWPKGPSSAPNALSHFPRSLPPPTRVRAVSRLKSSLISKHCHSILTLQISFLTLSSFPSLPIIPSCDASASPGRRRCHGDRRGDQSASARDAEAEPSPELQAPAEDAHVQVEEQIRAARVRFSCCSSFGHECRRRRFDARNWWHDCVRSTGYSI